MNWKTKPWKHQYTSWRRGIERLQKMGNFALLSETGTGKTKVLLDIITYFKERHPGLKTLVVCPKNVLKVWEEQIPLHSDHTFQILDGQAERRAAKLHAPADIYVINYDGVKILFMDVVCREWDLMILDESTCIKNSDSQVAKSVLFVGAHAKGRVISTGTPTAQGLQDVWSQWLFLDRGATFGSELDFRTAYLKNVGKYHTMWVPRGGAKERVWRKMLLAGVRYEKAKCLSLPPRTYNARRVVLEGDQQALYDRLLTVNPDGYEPAILLNKLAQVAGGFLYDDQRRASWTTKQAKLDALKALIEEIGPGQNIIVLCRYIAEAEMIKSVFYGQELDAWKQSDKPGILVSTVRKICMGENLQKAHYIVYYSNDYSVLARQQSEARIWRGGQKYPCTYYDLIAEGTSDEHVMGVLKRGIEVATISDEEILAEIERERAWRTGSWKHGRVQNVKGIEIPEELRRASVVKKSGAA